LVQDHVLWHRVGNPSATNPLVVTSSSMHCWMAARLLLLNVAGFASPATAIARLASVTRSGAGPPSSLAVGGGLRGGAAAGGEWWPKWVSTAIGGKPARKYYRQPLENDGDALYFGTITVGGQSIKALVDTGSFELLVFGVNCSICGPPEVLYNGSKSGTYVGSDFEAMHSFGSGTTLSIEAYDDIAIGPYKIKSQVFWEVVDADMEFLMEGTFQAIFGIGPPTSAIRFAEEDAAAVHEDFKTNAARGQDITPRTKSMVRHYDDLVKHAKNTTSVAEHLAFSEVSICLGKESGSSGVFIWNDATWRKSDRFTETKVIGDFYWSAQLGQVQLANATAAQNTSAKVKSAVGNRVLGCSDHNCSAIIDTGTSLLVVPSTVTEEVYDLIDTWMDAGGSCDDIRGLPDLHFQLNGLQFTLPPESYIGEVVGDFSDDLSTFMPASFRRRHEARWSDCMPLLMSMDAQSQFGSLWILGLPFFRKYYTTFKFIQNVGFRPEPSTMLFSEADEKCNPAFGLGPDQKRAFEAQLGGDAGALRSGPRKAKLRVDAKKIRIPHWIRRVHAQSQGKRKLDQFIRI